MDSFGGDTAPALLNEDDATLVSLAHRQFSRALGQLPEPDISLVRRWPFSLPQYAVGHLDRMTKLAELSDSFPGLYLIGNAYYGVGLPDLDPRRARGGAASGAGVTSCTDQTDLSGFAGPQALSRSI